MMWNRVSKIIINIFDSLKIKKPKPPKHRAVRFEFAFGLPTTKPQPRAVGFVFAFGLPKPKQKTHMPVTITITNEQKVTATLKPVSDTGKPAKLDGAPTWSVVTGLSTVVPAADGLSAELISADDPGDTQFLVKADADLGAGVVEISDTIDLTVQGALATNLGIAISAPVPKA
jgi:hypothetical protein